MRQKVWIYLYRVEQLELVLGTRLSLDYNSLLDILCEIIFKLLIRIQITLGSVKFVAEARFAIELIVSSVNGIL